MLGRKFLKKIFAVGAITVLGLSLLSGCSSSSNKGDKDSKKSSKTEIGILQFVEHDALDQTKKGFERAIKEKGYSKKVNIDFKNAQGDQSTNNTIAKKFVDDKKDLLFGIATPSAQALYNTTKETPILITAVTDPVDAGLVKSLEKPGTNVSGTSDIVDIKIQFKLLKELYPDAENIGIVYNTSEKNSEVQVKEAEKKAKEFGLKIEKVGITSTNDVGQAVSSVVDKVDAIYVPTDNVVVASMPIIVEKTLEKNIPVIATDTGSVKKGALATEGINYEKLGYETGLMAIDVIKGDDPKSMPMKTSKDTEVTINKKTLDKLGIELPESLKSKAKLI